MHGYDAMTDYYDVALKQARRDILLATPGYSDTVAMLGDMAALTAAAEEFQPQMIVHLAAQAGVRYSLEDLRAYVETNLIGTFNVLDVARIHVCTTC